MYQLETFLGPGRLVFTQIFARGAHSACAVSGLDLEPHALSPAFPGTLVYWQEGAQEAADADQLSPAPGQRVAVTRLAQRPDAQGVAALMLAGAQEVGLSQLGALRAALARAQGLNPQVDFAPARDEGATELPDGRVWRVPPAAGISDVERLLASAVTVSSLHLELPRALWSVNSRSGWTLKDGALSPEQPPELLSHAAELLDELDRSDLSRAVRSGVTEGGLRELSRELRLA